MKKALKILRSMLIVAMGIFFVGCGLTQMERDVLRIGIIQGKSEIPIIIAKEQGYFDEEGVNVEIISFQGPNYRDAAVQAEEIDGVVTDIMAVLAYTQSGFPMIMTSDINEDFKLIAAAGSEIETVEAFQGQKMVLAKNYLTHYVMDMIAEKHSLTYVLEVIPQIPARLEALKKGLVGGAVLGEPQASLLECDGIKIIADAEQDYGIEIGTIAFTQEFIKNNATEIKKFYNAYHKAIDYLNATDAQEYMSALENYGISAQIIPYLQTKEGKFEYAKDFSKNQFDSVLAWIQKQGIIKEDFTFEELTNFQYIK